PFVMKGSYEVGEKYSIDIQSFDEKTIIKFNYALNNFKDDNISVLNLKLSEMNLTNKVISEIEAITPVVVTIDNGPWSPNIHTIDMLMQQIYDNLEKKYRSFFKEEWNLRSDFHKYNLFEYITILSEKPIARKYKNVSLIGYKIRMNIGSTEVAQKLAKTAIVLGLGEKNSVLGSGFVKYREVGRK
ncbi:MAG: CRISPR-associated endoribonuclease Cas6, partial [Candidatus Cloacimonetes bacterium]|nr:CRISPR-associated endoribonuclease Cas6 [Candidatus Cloacimonadota bacterium]